MRASSSAMRAARVSGLSAAIRFCLSTISASSSVIRAALLAMRDCLSVIRAPSSVIRAALASMRDCLSVIRPPSSVMRAALLSIRLCLSVAKLASSTIRAALLSMRVVRFSYISNIKALAATCSPTETWILLTLPSISARISCCIFMASKMARR